MLIFYFYSYFIFALIFYETVEMGVDDDDNDDNNNDSNNDDSDTKKSQRETGDRPITILRNTLKWGHLCPTAPGTNKN